MQFIADTNGYKFIIMHWDNDAIGFLESNGFSLQDGIGINVNNGQGYVKEFKTERELSEGMELLLGSKWGVIFL